MVKGMNHQHTSAALTLSCVSAMSSFAFYAVRYFGVLRFYFYYFYRRIASPSERKLAC